MKLIRNKVLQLVAIAIIGINILLAVSPAALAGSPSPPICTAQKPATSFFGLPPWWEFLDGQPQQSLNGNCWTPTVDWRHGGELKIILAITDILLHVAGIAAVISILVSSVMYVTSAGSPERAKAALDRIISSLVGLAIAGVAATFVKFVGKRLVGNSPSTGYYNLPNTTNQNPLATGLEIFFGLLGVIAFLMMVIGGFNFVLSQGNPDKTARARNTLIYAGVGLAVAASAAFMVSVVLGKSS